LIGDDYPHTPISRQRPYRRACKWFWVCADATFDRYSDFRGPIRVLWEGYGIYGLK
jgi:hypothetical protein